MFFYFSSPQVFSCLPFSSGCVHAFFFVFLLRVLFSVFSSCFFVVFFFFRPFSRKTWRRAFHRGNMLLALSSCFATSNIADVRGCFKTAHVLHLHCMSWHTGSKIRFKVTFQRYIAKLHSKATWQGNTASAFHVVTYRSQVTFRSYVSTIHSKAT